MAITKHQLKKRSKINLIKKLSKYSVQRKNMN